MSSKIQQNIEQLEQQVAESVSEHRAKVEALGELAPSYEDAADMAELTVENITAAWSRGDATPTAADYVTAQAEQVRARLLHEGTVKLLERTRGLARSADRGVALVCADVLAESMPGVLTLATFADVRKLDPPKATQLPVVVIGQTKPSDRTAGGQLSGVAEVRYYRQSIHRALDPDGIVKSGERMGIGIKVLRFRTSPDGNVDSLAIQVQRGHLALPELRDIQDRGIKELSSLIAGDVARHLGNIEGRAAMYHRNDRLYSVKSTNIARAGTHLVSNTVDNDQRLAVVDAAISVTSVGGATFYNRAEQIGRAIAELEGQFVDGLGVCASVELVSDSPLNKRHLVSYVGPVDASTFAYDRHADTYVARATFRSTPVVSSVAA